MDIHEFQAKNLLLHYGVHAPPYAVAMDEREAIGAIRELGLGQVVLKAQVLAGGRGKAGGVKIANNPDEALQLFRKMLGMKIVNSQTGPQGIVAQKILISAPVTIEKEYYLAAAIDRETARPILIASQEGGVEIEEVARKNPEKILKIPFSLSGEVKSFHGLEMAKFLGWEGDLRKEGIKLLTQVAKAFIENDGTLLEINPLALTKERQLLALDAKFSIDDNALFRQPGIAQWYDPSQYPKNEVMAQEFNLAYIGLDGEIGCLVNGAGLAMATLDIVQYYGGKPANFLDVGGGATQEEIAHGFKIILMDHRVKAIFVNIFGGIMDCAILAQGIVSASKQETLKVPLIVRMEGTNVDAGKKILADSKLHIQTANTMEEGAIFAVKAAKLQA